MQLVHSHYIMKDKVSKYSQFFVGLIFSVSALTKAVNTAAFADLMSQYGATWFGFGAPLIILIEIFLGVLLIFDFYSKQITWASVVFLCGVSLVYLYGVFVKGITDCGCFGPITWLNSKPWLTFTRNGILLALLLPSLFSAEESVRPTILSVVFMAVIAVVVMFMCGFSFRGAKCLVRQHYFQPIALTDSPLNKFVDCHYDSTYMVFAFSYGCPYCQNSIANANQYLQMGAVDDVIGLAIEDSLACERFHRLFEVNFTIREISPTDMMLLTTVLPTVYMIRHDSIVNWYTGMLVSPALYMP